MKNRHSNAQEPLNDMTTVSALLEPRGSIFQNGFLYGVQFKFGYNLTQFLPIYDLNLGFLLGLY